MMSTLPLPHPSCRDTSITICMTVATAPAIKFTQRFLCLWTAPCPQTPDWGTGGVWEWTQQPQPGAALPSPTPTAHPEGGTLGPPGHPSLGVPGHPPTQNPPKWDTQDPSDGTPNPPPPKWATLLLLDMDNQAPRAMQTPQNSGVTQNWASQDHSTVTSNPELGILGLPQGHLKSQGNPELGASGSL